MPFHSSVEVLLKLLALSTVVLLYYEVIPKKDFDVFIQSASMALKKVDDQSVPVSY